MSTASLLFVTTPNADHKIINRMLLHLRNWEYGDEGTWDSFHVIRSKDLDILKASIKADEVNATIPPVQDDATNEWQNSTIEEVETFVLQLNKLDENVLKDSGLNTSVFLLFDDKGVEDKTCIVAERKFDDETEELTESFDKVRVPWEEVHTVWANLDIANMDFADYCDQDAWCDENNWWKWDQDGGIAGDLDEEYVEMRREALRKFEEEGKA